MLDKLEKKIGKYAIKNLIYYVLGGYAVGYILLLLNERTGLYSYITLDPAMVMQGQVWRIFTWIFTVPQSLSLWVIFMFMLYYFIGRSLEATIGTFRYNVYIFSGWFFMTLGAMIVYWVTAAIFGESGAISIDASTYYINLTSFLAFAVLYPDYKIFLFGLIPLKMKWLAIFDVVYMGFEIFAYIFSLTSDGQSVMEQYYSIDMTYYRAQIYAEIFSIIVSMLNFLIFFLTNRKLRHRTPQQMYRRAQFRRSYNQGQKENRGGSEGTRKSYRPDTGAGSVIHRCAVCGRTSADHPELTFRYCSKCNGNHEYCQDHLFTHEHVK